MKKCVIIYNPVSGKQTQKECIEDFYVTLKKYGYDLELIYTKKKGDACQIIKNLKHPDLVICAGGDGTLNEAVKGNLERQDRLLLAPLPLGTTNDVGMMYGLKKDYVKNLELLLQGVRKKVDIGTINKHPFVYIAAFGNITNISYVTPHSLKRKFGHFAYVLQGVKEFFKKTEKYDLQYKINGKTYKGTYSFIFITNTTTIGGKKNIYSNIKLNDRLLEVAFLKSYTKKDLLKTLFYIITNRSKQIPNVEFYQTSNIEIIFDKPLERSWCIDGEELVLNSSRVKISVNSDSSLLVPTIHLEKLFK